MLTNVMVEALVKMSVELGESEITVNDTEYRVFPEDEVKEQFKDYQESLFDDIGFDSFTSWAKDTIIEDFVEEAYFEDIEREYLENTYDDEFGDMDEDDEDYETLDEYIDFNMSTDSKEWYIEFMGQEAFDEAVKDNSLLDFEGMCEWLVEQDGYSCLASYDGVIEEYDYDGTIYYVWSEG